MLFTLSCQNVKADPSSFAQLTHCFHIKYCQRSTPNRINTEFIDLKSNKMDVLLTYDWWIALLDRFGIFYCPPTKLRKGNVFSRVCLSVCLSPGGPHVTIIHYALDFTIQNPPLYRNPSPALALPHPHAGTTSPGFSLNSPASDI